LHLVGKNDNSSQEECGVWLDPVQLKIKAKQVKSSNECLRISISSYNLAVALNFTQTKMEMPKTKQSSITNFFTPHRQGKPNTCKIIREFMKRCKLIIHFFISSKTVASGKKRERDERPRKSDFNVDCEWGNENVPETKTAASQNQRGHDSSLLNRQSEEFEAPENKKRHVEPSLFHLPPLDSESSFLDGLQNSTLLLKHTSRHGIKPGKEQGFDSAWSKTSTSPLLPNQEVDEDALLFTLDSEGFRVIAHRDPPSRSPLKDQSNLGYGMVSSASYKPVEEEEDEEDGMLFTQDSQGNLVIKH
uniref:Uncharacterized protein n=1 Tax=Nothobranchius furzeri TaxID=105023 RepID=A0A8C6NZB0_NOTFU